MSTPPSKNTNVTRISIPTEQLRALLPEDALVEIERVAVEKIAEEVRRKLTEKRQNVLDIVRESVAHIVKQDMEAQTGNLNASWRFPAAGKAIVAELATKAMQAQADKSAKIAADTAADSLRARVSYDIDKAMIKFTADMTKLKSDAVSTIQEVIDTKYAALDGYISRKARTEFLAVLKEAKEAGL